MLARMNASSVQQARFLGTPLVVRTTVARCSAKARPDASVEPKEVAKITAASAVAATLLSSGHALAAQEVAQLAESDNRLGALLLLLGPALGWVLYNIGGPASRQLDDMSGKKSVVGALGLGAAGLVALTADQASAATQVAQLAESDNRLGALLLLLGPAVGWVLYNIGGPASRQLDDMKRGAIAGLGLGAASLLVTQNAEAAQMIGTVAESDNRLGALLLLLGPAIGWVLYNIGGPASRQLDDMSKK